MNTQKVTQPGIKDIPSVPASLHKGSAPALGSAIAAVPDRKSAEQCKGR